MARFVLSGWGDDDTRSVTAALRQGDRFVCAVLRDTVSGIDLRISLGEDIHFSIGENSALVIPAWRTKEDLLQIFAELVKDQLSEP